MNMFVVVVFVFFVVRVKCINREKFQKFPRPHEHFDVKRYLGNWYIVARLPSCNFAGSRDFSNSVSEYSLEPDGTLNCKGNFRSSQCTMVEFAKIPTKVPGYYINKDPIGNPTTGPSLMIDTDYVSYVVIWGCAKALGVICQDPYLIIKTRRRKPRQLTWKIIEAVLQSHFEISLGEMVMVSHDSKTGVTSINWKQFQTFPHPQKNFDVYKYVGDWYYVAKIPPCSWSSSSEFTNIVSQYSLQNDGILDQRVAFRSVVCTFYEVTKTPKDKPGIYESKDPIGNPMSGPSVVLATDYKRFAITWGCTSTAGNMCKDPYLYVKTRKKKPDAKTWKFVQAILKFYFEMSLSELVIIPQDDKELTYKSNEPSRYYQKNCFQFQGIILTHFKDARRSNESQSIPIILFCYLWKGSEECITDDNQETATLPLSLVHELSMTISNYILWAGSQRGKA